MLEVVAVRKPTVPRDKVERDRSLVWHGQRFWGRVFLLWRGRLPGALLVSDIIDLLG